MSKQIMTFVFLAFISAVTTITGAAEGYKVETIGALTEPKVSAELRNVLDSKGLRVTDAKGKVVCEIWLRQDLAGDGEEVAAAVFSKIGEGSLAGVINFPGAAGDFRGQGLKPGWFTLRYGLILQDGNHLGVSATRDFFILCPIGEESNPQKRLTFDEMIKLSRNASGTGHPSCWSLMPATDEKGLPRIVTNEHEHVVVEFTLSTKAGPLAIGMVVVGKTEG
jgi:hypothetical protein